MLLRIHTLVRLAAFAAVSTTLGATLEATTLQQLSLSEMSRQSTEIVRARVTGANGIARGADVFTVYHCQILERWKGDLTQGSVEVAVPGGVANGMRQMVPGAPTLQNGEEYVLFLWTGR